MKTLRWLLAAALLVASTPLYAQVTWTRVGGEYGSFTCAGTDACTIRYGVDPTVDAKTVQKAYPAGTTRPCNNAEFARDPDAGNGKACWQMVGTAVVTPPVTQPPAAQLPVPPPCFPNNPLVWPSASYVLTAKSATTEAYEQVSLPVWLMTDSSKAAAAIYWSCGTGDAKEGFFLDAMKDEIPGFRDDVVVKSFEALKSMDVAALQALWASRITCTREMDQTLPACLRYKEHRIARNKVWFPPTTTPPPVVTPPPPAERWRVRDNPVGPSRPVFGVTYDNVRIKTEMKSTEYRVADDATCDPTKNKIVEGTSIYVSVAGQPNVSKPGQVLPVAVALCQKLP